MTNAARDVLHAARPWQWVKNGVVLLPWAFGQKVSDHEATNLVILTVAAYCALASGTYLANDVADRGSDAADPLRRHRAIAAGRLSSRAAIGWAAAAFAIGFALLAPVALARGPHALAIGAGYVALTTVYSFSWKRFAASGAAVIALGFVLRVFAGGVAAGVAVSHWLTLCTFLGALYVALEKRAADARALARAAAGSRVLERAARIAALAFVAGYALYTVSERTREIFGTAWLSASVPPIVLGVLRFGFLARRPGAAADPARAFLTDPPLLGCVIVYVVICAAVLRNA